MQPLAAIEGKTLRRLHAAELSGTPGQARPLAGTAELLHALAVMPGTRVALVSGRSIVDLRRFLDIPGAYYVGLHGLELCVPGGTNESTEDVASVLPIMPEIRGVLEDGVAGRPGVLIENKGAALACHSRLASREDALSVRHALAAVVDAYHGKRVPITLAHGHGSPRFDRPAQTRGRPSADSWPRTAHRSSPSTLVTTRPTRTPLRSCPPSRS